MAEKLSPTEFESLFALDLPAYNSKVPGWVKRVEPIDMREGVNELLKQLKDAEKKTTKLERVLNTHNIPIPQDIPYVVAKQKVIEIQQRIMGGDVDEKTYIALCTELEKYSTAMMASDEYHEEVRQKEAQWEEQHRAENKLALQKLRRHMPINVRFLSEDALVKDHKLPKPIARKFKRTDVLSLIRKSPDALEKSHPGILENLKTGGLTLTERRALYEHLRTVAPKWIKAKDEMSQRKAQWYANFKTKFKEQADAAAATAKKHGCSLATPNKCKRIGMQCPFKADAQMDYSGDYGFPTGDVYEQDDVTKAPKPFVKEESKPQRPANPMAAAIAAKGAGAKLKAAPPKPSFLGELSKKKAAAPDKRTSFTAMQAIPKKDPSRRNVLKQIQKKTPAELEAEKKAQAAAQAEKKFAAKKAARDNILETHYKRSEDDLYGARAICQSMEDAMEDMEEMLKEWIDYVIRSGGKKLEEDAIEEEIWDFKDGIDPLANVVDQYLERLDDVGPSTVECELAEDLYLCTAVFFNFIQWRMASLKKKDADLTKSINETQANLKKMAAKNSRKLKQFGIKAERTRKIPVAKELMDEKKKEIEILKQKTKPKPAAPAAAPKADEPIPRTSNHKMRPSVAAKPAAPLKRHSSFSSRTMEHQGKEHLKWQLVHQVNDAQKMVRRLETAITGAGLTVPDDTIPYQEAEAKIAELSKQMAEISFKDPGYFKLEQEMAKYQAALMASDEYRRETERREREWEDRVRPAGREALKQLRRHMPVEIRKMTTDELSKKIPPTMAKKFKRTNVLQLIRVNPNDVIKFHFSNFEGLSLTGLTLTERRALYEHLHCVGPKWFKGRSNQQTERKWMWFQSMKNKFKDDLRKYETQPERNAVDYSKDYGFPDGPVYETMEVAKEDLSYSQKRAAELRKQKQGDSPARPKIMLPGKR